MATPWACLRMQDDLTDEDTGIAAGAFLHKAFLLPQSGASSIKKKKGGGGGGSFVVYCGEFLMPGNRPCVPVSHVSPVGSVHLSHKLLFTCSMLHLGSEGTNPR